MVEIVMFLWIIFFSVFVMIFVFMIGLGWLIGCSIMWFICSLMGMMNVLVDGYNDVDV